MPSGLGREKAEAVYAVFERAQTVFEAEALDNEGKAKLRDAVWAEVGELVSPDALMLMKNTPGFRVYWLRPPKE